MVDTGQSHLCVANTLNSTYNIKFTIGIYIFDTNATKFPILNINIRLNINISN